MEKETLIAQYGELWGKFMHSNGISHTEQYVEVLKTLIEGLQGLQFREGFALLEHAKEELKRRQRYTAIGYPPDVEEYDRQHGGFPQLD